MRRLWVLLALLTIAVCYSPMILTYVLSATCLIAVALMLYKKFIRKNKESLAALFLSVLLDQIALICRTLRYLNFVSDVESLRAPNYMTLLLKPHPEVTYERMQIKDDTINMMIYRPKVIKNDGLIVYAHGGGWVMFTARMFHSAVSWIAHECQMVTISVDYRRPPEHPFPTPLLDVHYTVLWAQLNAQKLGIDASKVVLMGDSSGGNLAAAATTLHRDDKELDKHSFPAIRAQVLIYPVLQSYNYSYGSYIEKDLTNLRKYVSYYIAGDLSLNNKAGDPAQYKGVPAYWSAVVGTSVTGKDLAVKRSLESSPDNLDNVYAFPLLDDDPNGLPPTFVLALTRDAIRDDGEHYAKWLEYSGVRVKYVEESQANHGFMFLYGTDECALSYLKSLAKFVWQNVEE